MFLFLFEFSEVLKPLHVMLLEVFHRLHETHFQVIFLVSKVNVYSLNYFISHLPNTLLNKKYLKNRSTLLNRKKSLKTVSPGNPSFVTAHSFQKPSIICAYVADYLKTVIPEVVPLNLDPNTVKLVIFVPESHKELVKSSAFAAGAGEQDEYQQCCWETKGRGQFRPSSKTNPF